ncbi:MAG: protease inhibitor I9 family protein, partial [Actinomycetota bacterium]
MVNRRALGLFLAASAVVVLLPTSPAAASSGVAPGVRSTPDAWSTPGNTSANGKDYIVILKDSASVVAKVRNEESLGNDVSNVFSSKVKGFGAELDNADVRRLKQDSQVLVVEPDSTMSVIDTMEPTTTTSVAPTTTSTVAPTTTSTVAPTTSSTTSTSVAPTSSTTTTSTTTTSS